MTKRFFIVHGWEGSPEKNWMPWITRQLESKGYDTVAIAMPNPDNPNMQEWVKCLTDAVGTPNPDTYIIGHSLGCITILRYLETLKGNNRICGLVLVAGFTSNLGYEELESFFKERIEWNTIRENCRKFIAIYSDNDQFVSTHYGAIFNENLSAKEVLVHGKGHFDQEVMQEVLDAALSISE